MRSFEWSTAAVSAAVSAVITAAAIFYSIPTPKHEQTEEKPKDKPAYSPEIRDEQQARTRAFLKTEGMEKLAKTKVTVVGVGGVGSWAATMLVRNGIGTVKLVDFDQVSLSSLNRHACATLRDVGTPKVDCLAQYLGSIAPWCSIEPVNCLFELPLADELLVGSDYVVDCIDNLNTKVDLLAYCHERQIPVVSSMGSGAKADPTRVVIGDISQTFEDPLSRTVRISLKARGITSGIPTVFSTEKPSKEKAKLLDVPEEQVAEGNVAELSVLQKFRVRIIPVLGPMPAIFGLTLATHLLNVIGGYNQVFDPALGGYSYSGKNRTKLYESLKNSIQKQATRLGFTGSYANLTEIEYLTEEVWRGKTLNGEHSRPKLSLWDPKGTRSIHNMILLTAEEQKRHEELVFKEGKALSEVYSPEELATVKARKDLDRYYMQFRVN